MLSDSDQIREDLGEAYNLLEAGDRAMIPSLSIVSDSLSKVNMSLLKKMAAKSLMRRLESLRIELKDISETVYDYLDGLNQILRVWRKSRPE